MSDSSSSRARCLQDAINNLQYLIEHSSSEEMRVDFMEALAGCVRHQERIKSERESAFSQGAGFLQS
jgi:hypothetical protein